MALAGQLDEPLAVEEHVDRLLAVAAGDDDAARAERVDRARASSRRRRVIRRRHPASARASGRFGVTTVARGSSSSISAACARPGRAARAPDSATITGSSTTGVPAVELVERARDRLDRRDGAEHPDLDRVDADVAVRPRGPARRSLRAGSRATRGRPPTVFCAVIAVIAVIPCTPQAANALRSAWMPAPPPESEPAIDSTRREVRAAASEVTTAGRLARSGVTAHVPAARLAPHVARAAPAEASAASPRRAPSPARRQRRRRCRGRPPTASSSARSSPAARARGAARARATRAPGAEQRVEHVLRARGRAARRRRAARSARRPAAR